MFNQELNATVSMPNVIDPTYTGTIYISANLTFYTENSENPVPEKIPEVFLLRDATKDPWNLTSIGYN